MKTCENCGGLDTEESDARTNAYLAAERRERIATACLAGMLAREGYGTQPGTAAMVAVRHADALIAALDAPVKP